MTLQIFDKRGVYGDRRLGGGVDDEQNVIRLIAPWSSRVLLREILLRIVKRACTIKSINSSDYRTLIELQLIN